MPPTLRLFFALSCSAGALTPGLAVATPPQAEVTLNETPVTPALRCLARRPSLNGLPRLAVGRIGDLTGKIDFDTGAKITQGASLFAVSALGYAGVPVVERLDNSVAEIELNYARQKLLSDTPERAGQSGDNFRPILAGQIAGSRYYIVGGITELNYNIRSDGYDAAIGSQALPGAQGQISGRTYVLNVAVDLRLVNTQTQQVVDTVTFQKQVIGVTNDRRLTGGSEDIGLLLQGGNSRQEPLQMSVRELVERSVYHLIAPLWTATDARACLSGSGLKAVQP
ncbi:holdfast anchoring protein HfaB [Asticcacaulis excentricus]|uniref:Curli production assembly/transport component CsgG n=1 Tax=Asticcacaulis excentricus (strain ATCC 15261 / DSM 4724 / KCTC 12464 / NCIMB 9791 / VKM B-1370 / CB 48) TaxID=573065 RepID=E8RN64_ASTEC|nr:holdfast anchoring protein HfaB [Asticcacaulis excentricus]ADU12897.1 Curli production assembly/transport component CsgG [Asticcacaulis excentricus CB 48]